MCDQNTINLDTHKRPKLILNVNFIIWKELELDFEVKKKL